VKIRPYLLGGRVAFRAPRILLIEAAPNPGSADARRVSLNGGRWRTPQSDGFNLGRRPVHRASIIRSGDFEN